MQELLQQLMGLFRVGEQVGVEVRREESDA
jgi:hypothetical protein